MWQAKHHTRYQQHCCRLQKNPQVLANCRALLLVTGFPLPEAVVGEVSQWTPQGNLALWAQRCGLGSARISKIWDDAPDVEVSKMTCNARDSGLGLEFRV